MVLLTKISTVVLALLTMLPPAPVSAAEPSGGTGTANEPTATEIQRWVEGLGAKRFGERAFATQKLIAAGRPAIDPVVEAVKQGDLEVIVRGIHVLREIALSHTSDDLDTALMALEQLARITDSSTGRRAAETLNRLAGLRQRRAKDELRQLGATVHMPETGLGRQIMYGVDTLEIDEKFRGNGEDLARLRWLPDVRQVVFEGPQVKDEWLAHLAKMTSLHYLTLREVNVGDVGLAHVNKVATLQHVRILYCPLSDRSMESLKGLKGLAKLSLFGTKVTSDGAKQLADALDTTEVDYRQGAFLGIGGDAHPLGFIVGTVHEKSAASRAGLQYGDVITKFAGQKAPDFEALTALIGKQRPGDTVKIELIRRGQTMNKEVQLGEWQ
jgi:hypothetical protein